MFSMAFKRRLGMNTEISLRRMRKWSDTSRCTGALWDGVFTISTGSERRIIVGAARHSRVTKVRNDACVSAEVRCD
jgi:hypothetical protein